MSRPQRVCGAVCSPPILTRTNGCGTSLSELTFEENGANVSSWSSPRLAQLGGPRVANSLKKRVSSQRRSPFRPYH